MSPGPEKKRVQFRAPRGLMDRTGTPAAVFETDRTDILTSAPREYLRDTTRSSEAKQEVTEAHHDDAITFEESEPPIGHEGVANFRLLKQQLSKASVDDVAEELADTQMMCIAADASALVSLGTVADVTTNPLDLPFESHELLFPKQALEKLVEIAPYDDASGGYWCSVKYWIVS